MSRLRQYALTPSAVTWSFRDSIRVESAFCDCNSVSDVCFAATHKLVVQGDNTKTKRLACPLYLLDIRRHRFVLDLSKHNALSFCVVINTQITNGGRSGAVARLLRRLTAWICTARYEPSLTVGLLPRLSKYACHPRNHQTQSHNQIKHHHNFRITPVVVN